MENSQNKSEPKTQEHNIREYLLLAFERTGTEPYNLDLIINDVLTEFKGISGIELKKALRNGGLGKYGKTYKLTCQDVCIWIREYLKSKNLGL